MPQPPLLLFSSALLIILLPSYLPPFSSTSSRSPSHHRYMCASRHGRGLVQYLLDRGARYHPPFRPACIVPIRCRPDSLKSSTLFLSSRTLVVLAAALARCRVQHWNNTFNRSLLMEFFMGGMDIDNIALLIDKARPRPALSLAHSTKPNTRNHRTVGGFAGLVHAKACMRR
eukprot:2180091-Rhodomonas_salina.1